MAVKNKEVRVFGAMAVEVFEIKDVAKARIMFYEKGVWLRPLKKYLYLCLHIFWDEEVRKLCSINKEYFSELNWLGRILDTLTQIKRGRKIIWMCL